VLKPTRGKLLKGRNNKCPYHHRVVDLAEHINDGISLRCIIEAEGGGE